MTRATRAKPKASAKSRATRPRKATTKAETRSRGGVKAKPGAGGAATETTASRLIDRRIIDLGGWRGRTLARMRTLVLEADPEMTEEWKWSTPVWSHDGIVCTGEAYTKVVKLTFARGASIEDPSRLFNSSLKGNTRRAIDIHEGTHVDAGAFKALVKAALARNGSSAKARAKARPIKVREGEKVPVLLSGGNPRIAKADGDAPVQAYIAAMPGWKRAIGKRLDALVARNVPKVRKAVKWNSPMYGIDGQGWFLAFHVFTRYVKVTFFRGTSLRPVPPGGTSKDARWIDVHEDDLDAAQMARWVKQAAALPGWVPGR
jgi:hypothetical protein